MDHRVDQYRFWQAQLDGDNPDTTPGTPHAGFYFLNRRRTFPDPQLGRRNRVEHVPETIAIWRDKNGDFIMRIADTRGTTRIINDQMAIDNTFARVCRNAIDYETYCMGPANIDLSFDRSLSVKEGVRRSTEFLKGEPK